MGWEAATELPPLITKPDDEERPEIEKVYSPDDPEPEVSSTHETESVGVVVMVDSSTDTEDDDDEEEENDSDSSRVGAVPGDTLPDNTVVDPEKEEERLDESLVQKPNSTDETESTTSTTLSNSPPAPNEHDDQATTLHDEHQSHAETLSSDDNERGGNNTLPLPLVPNTNSAEDDESLLQHNSDDSLNTAPAQESANNGSD